MFDLRSSLLRRCLSLVLTVCFAVSAVETAVAEVHDGGATHAEVDRVTGTDHAGHQDLGSNDPDRRSLTTPYTFAIAPTFTVRH